MSEQGKANYEGYRAAILSQMPRWDELSYLAMLGWDAGACSVELWLAEHPSDEGAPESGARADTPPDDAASPEQPVYRKLHQGDAGATRMYMITCDEGWRSSIVCADVYEHVADWLLGILGRKPYAGEH